VQSSEKWQKTVGIEAKLNITSRHEKGKQISDLLTVMYR
jgi:hypothetical protein